MKIKFLYRKLFSFLGFFTISRIVFFLVNKPDVYSNQFLAKAFWLGLKFDLRLSIFLTLPFLLVPLRKKWHLVLDSLLVPIILFTTMLDFGYYSYLKARLNATVFTFLKNPIISLKMVTQSYPIYFLTFVFIILTFIFIFLSNKLYIKEKSSRPKIYYFLFILFCIAGGYGNTQMYPLRWSDAFFSPDPFISNLTLNPMLYVIDTYSFKKSDVNQADVKNYYDIVSDFLSVDHKDTIALNFIRETKNPSWPFDFSSVPTHSPNVVVIIMESMGHARSSMSKSNLDATPELKKLAESSLYFPHFYTPTVATARSIFAAITSLPDVSKNKTGSRNPLIVNQHVAISNANENGKYQSYYFIGGSANWGNIRGILSHNLPGLKIFEEGDYHYPSNDVWGISDLSLFKSAIETFDAEKKSFISVIQTAGFHRPFTIPNENSGFIPVSVSDQELKKGGFESLAEYNALRLEDYSLGKFIEMAKTKPWYKNTIFIVFGDHGLPMGSAPHVGDWERALSQGFHVPMVMHGPQFFKPRIENKIASEMDIMPTVAHLTGIPFKTRSLGRDLFDSRYDKYRAAFSYNWYAPFHITLIDADYYFEYIPYNDEGKLNRYTSATPNQDLKSMEENKYREMKTLTKGLYETAKYLMENNPHF